MKHSSDSSSLRERILQSGMWATILNISDRVIWLVKTVVLARLLFPDDFGILGLSIIIVDTARQFSYLGLDEALIGDRDEDVDQYLDTVWTIKIIRGIGVVFLTAASAVLVSSFLSEPELILTVPFVAMAYLFKDAVNPSTIYFRKDLKFKRQFFYIISGTITGAISAITLAVILGNYWALIIDIFIRQGTRLAISFYLTEERPSFGVDRSVFTHLFGYGKWIYATAIVGFLANMGDDLFVGLFLTTSALGFYRLAFQVSNAPATEVTQIITNVMFPAFSKIQDSYDSLSHAYTKVLELNLLIVTPASIGVIAIAPEFVEVIFTDKWTPMILPLQILTIAGFFRSIAKTGSAIFRGARTPYSDFNMNLIRLVIIISLIYPLTSIFGIVGTAASVAGGLAASMIAWFIKTSKITDINFRDLVHISHPSFIASFTMFFFVRIIISPTIIHLVLSICLGAFSYFVLILTIYNLEKRSLQELFSIVPSEPTNSR